MHPRKLVRDAVGFAAAQYAIRALLMMRGIVAAGLLGPGGYGAWNAIGLIFDYGANATLGTQQGLDQTVPSRLVDGDAARLRRTLRAGLFNIVTLSLAFGVIVLLYLTRQSESGQILGFWGIGGVLMALACVLCVNLSNLHTTVLRSVGDIRTVSLWFVLQGAVGAALGLALCMTLGAWGLLVGWVVANLLALGFARWRSPRSVPAWPAPSSEGLALIRTGFPIFLYNGSSTVMRTIDRIVVLRFLGAEGLGYYGISVMVLNLLLYAPDALAYVLYPQFLTAYRAGGDQPDAIRDRALGAMRMIALVVPALGGVAFLLGREAVLALLPSYAPGATAVRVMCYAAGGLAVSSMASMVLMTMRRQTVLVPLALLATGLGAALDIAALRAGMGISGVAWATFVTYVFNGVLMLWFAAGALRLALGERLMLVIKTFTPLAISLGLAFGLDRLIPGSTGVSIGVGLVRSAIEILLFLGLYAVLTRPLARGLGLRQIVMGFRLPGFPRRTNGEAGE